MSARQPKPSRFVPILAGVYLLIWTALAIRPTDRGDWLLENLLIFASAAVLIPTYRRFQFSNLSYVLLALFMVFHTIGAHYTYAKVPFGFWLQDWFELKRNHYDRLIHFSFGLLLVYPAREIMSRIAGARDSWAIGLSVVFIIALSSFFEIVEAIVAWIVNPELGAAYLGTQGDIWDAQKDMALAALGAILATSATAWLRPRAP